MTRLISEDMKSALGVAEPGAIASAGKKAKSCTHGDVEFIGVKFNSDMYENAFTCGIPNSPKVGSVFAAALGVVAGKEALGLETLVDVVPEDMKKAQRLLDEGKVQVALDEISSRIFIEVCVKTLSGEVVVTIKGSHTNITKVVVNGEAELEKSGVINRKRAQEEQKRIHQYTLRQLYEYTDSEKISELEFIWKAYCVNVELFEEGMKSPRTILAKYLLKKNGGVVFSGGQKTASLLCDGAIEARGIVLNKQAMSVTGSGAHEIIATLPLYAAYKVNGYSW